MEFPALQQFRLHQSIVIRTQLNISYNLQILIANHLISQTNKDYLIFKTLGLSQSGQLIWYPCNNIKLFR
jgi:hypothetical protein